MSTESLSRVTLQTLENYRVAATQTMEAYRAGSHRLVDAVNGTLEQRVYPRTAKLAPRATERMNEVRGGVSEIVVKGIDQVTERTERVIEFGSSTATAQVEKMAGLAAGVENRFVADSLESAARATLPMAKLALAVSGKVAEGATALAGAAGARPAKRAVRKAAAGAKRRATPRKAGARRAKNATV